MTDAMLIGGAHEDDDTYFALTVTNRGDLPTTITHMVVCDYETIWRRLARRLAFNAIVTKPNTYGRDIPFVLDPGQMWQGQVRAGSDENLSQRRSNGWLYVGVFASHREHPYLLRVKKQLDI